MLILMRQFFCLIMLFACACERQRNDQLEIRWDKSIHFDQMVWYINESSVGKGSLGFDSVFKALERLDNGALVKVNFPGALWNPSVKGYSSQDVFPLLEKPDLRTKLYNLLNKKQLSFQFQGLPSKS